MVKTVLKGNLFLQDEIQTDAFLVMEDGYIREILDDYAGDYIDHSGKAIAPGLFDTHIHGFKGYDVMDCVESSVQALSLALPEMGVTSFLATTLTSSDRDLDTAMSVLRESADKLTGAKLMGIFLEGPFFTSRYKGAQNPRYMEAPNIERLQELQELSGGMIRKIAIAPEYENTTCFVKKAREMGIYIALGHSNANYVQAKAAVEAGASIFVHTFNAMRGLHHREPGMVGAAMNLKETYSELIADGHHVHPVSANILMDVKGRDKIVLVTDCMMAGGMPDGEYSLGEYEVTLKDGYPMLSNGALAGSLLYLSEGIRNTTEWGIATLFQSLKMASYNAALSVGLEDRVGLIKPGRSADVIVMDLEGNLQETFLDGKLVYRA